MRHKPLWLAFCAAFVFAAAEPAVFGQEQASEQSKLKADTLTNPAQDPAMEAIKNEPATSGGTRKLPVLTVDLVESRKRQNHPVVMVSQAPSNNSASFTTSASPAALETQTAGASGDPQPGTLPLWTFNVRASRDRHRHPGAMVGRDPFNNPGSVSVPTNVIPLIIKTKTVGVSVDFTTGVITTHAGNTTFNPTVADNVCLTEPNNVPTKLVAESPIFSPATFNFGGTVVGTTQYVDAFQRANFWNALGDEVAEYHVLLDPVRFLDPIVLNVPKNEGLALIDGLVLGPPAFCAPLGIVDINWFDAYLTGTILPSLAESGVNPTNFPIFLVYNVVWASPVTNIFTCCALGYHGFTGYPLPTQTYSPNDFDSTGAFFNASGSTAPFSDTAVLSHEVAEWIDDPIGGNNETPPWGNVGQVVGCDPVLEVGDPLTGTAIPSVTMPNGFSYHLQELAFISWFFGAPSIGVNGWFSNNGTFLTSAGPVCP